MTIRFNWFNGSAAANLKAISGFCPLIAGRAGVSNENFSSYGQTPGATDGALGSWAAGGNNQGYAPFVRAVI